VWFHEGNKIEYTFNFGCGVFVGPEITPPESMFVNAGAG
jgi:hypothetical protein